MGISNNLVLLRANGDASARKGTKSKEFDGVSAQASYDQSPPTAVGGCGLALVGGCGLEIINHHFSG